MHLTTSASNLLPTAPQQPGMTTAGARATATGFSTCVSLPSSNLSSWVPRSLFSVPHPPDPMVYHIPLFILLLDMPHINGPPSPPSPGLHRGPRNRLASLSRVSPIRIYSRAGARVNFLKHKSDLYKSLLAYKPPLGSYYLVGSIPSSSHNQVFSSGWFLFSSILPWSFHPHICSLASPGLIHTVTCLWAFEHVFSVPRRPFSARRAFIFYSSFKSQLKGHLLRPALVSSGSQCYSLCSQNPWGISSPHPFHTQWWCLFPCWSTL